MDWIRQTLALVVVFGLLGVLLWLNRAKRALLWRSTTENGTRIEVLERVALTPTHSVHLVRAGARELLLGVHSSGLTVLHETTHEEAKH